MNICIIGIGSNIEPEKHIKETLIRLSENSKIIKISQLIKTKPVGIEGQPDFINGAVKIGTNLSRLQFNKYLKKIEDQMGRDRSVPKFGPRKIDLDIIAWNGHIVDQDYYKRDFVKKTVDEIIVP